MEISPPPADKEEAEGLKEEDRGGGWEGEYSFDDGDKGHLRCNLPTDGGIGWHGHRWGIWE